MAEIREGLRNVLAHPAVYDFFQRSTGAYAWRKRTLARYAQPHLTPGASVLDIGCGTGALVSCLPQHVSYDGFDRNEAYIERARRRFAQDNIAFHCEEFDGRLHYQSRKFDVVLAFGLLHHLDDDEVRGLNAAVKTVLADGGIFLTLDPVRTAQQSSIARFLVSNDRGRNVRTADEYSALASDVFSKAEGVLDDDPMYIPYTGYVLRCAN